MSRRLVILPLAMSLAASCGETTNTPAAISIPMPDLSLVADRPLVDAVTAALAAVEAAPADVAGLERYGALLAAHDWKVEAAGVFARAEQLDPKNFRWPYLQGVLLALKDVPAALSAMERALKLDADYAPAHSHLGKLLVESARLAEARSHFMQAIQLDAGWLDAWLSLGQLELQEKRPQAAKTALERALLLDPDHPEVHSALASACFALGEKDAAQEHARIARTRAARLRLSDPRAELRCEPVTAVDHQQAGMAKFARGEAAEAEALLRKALAIDPKLQGAWLQLANVLLQKKDVAGTEAALRSSSAIAPNAAGELLLARVLAQKNLPDEAAEHLLTAAVCAPHEARFHQELALEFARLQRFDAAAAELATALALLPDEAQPRQELATAAHAFAQQCLRENAARAAASALRTALAARPGQSVVERDLAQILAVAAEDSVRNGAEAVHLAEHAFVGHDEDPEYLDVLGAAYAEVGRFPDAIHMAERALGFARAKSKGPLVQRITQRLELYRAGKPVRMGAPGK